VNRVRAFAEHLVAAFDALKPTFEGQRLDTAGAPAA
jgi:hypothetical protein